MVYPPKQPGSQRVLFSCFLAKLVSSRPLAHIYLIMQWDLRNVLLGAKNHGSCHTRLWTFNIAGWEKIPQILLYVCQGIQLTPKTQKHRKLWIGELPKPQLFVLHSYQPSTGQYSMTLNVPTTESQRTPCKQELLKPCHTGWCWVVCHMFKLKPDTLNVQHFCDWFAILSHEKLDEYLACYNLLLN